MIRAHVTRLTRKQGILTAGGGASKFVPHDAEDAKHKNRHHHVASTATTNLVQQVQQRQQSPPPQPQSRRRFHSSTYSYRGGVVVDPVVANMASVLVTDRLKSQLLDRAVQDDSPLWQQQPPPPKKPLIPKSSQRNHGIMANMNDHHDDEPDDDDHHDHDDDIDTSTVAHLWDPLDDLNVSDQPARYWPDLPISNIHKNIDPFVLCQEELSNVSQDIRNDLLGTDHPVLHQAANYFFNTSDGGGKKFRPLLVHLMAKALAQAAAVGSPDHTDTTTIVDDDDDDDGKLQKEERKQHRRYARLAEISELIHTASLFHDDVIDNADTRRGRPAVHAVFGDKMAILAGDYLLARASIGLARLRNVKVVETMSTIIEHLVRGEVMQMKGNSSTNSNNNNTSSAVRDRMDYYLRKNFYKTGSLMANSCRSTAILGNYPDEWVDLAYRYGKHTGMAFQLVDDILDFEGSASHMGKPALADLHSGVATAPVLFAAEEYPDQLIPLMDRKFANPGDVSLAVELVMTSSGMDRTRQLARVHAEIAMDAILELTPHETNPDTTLYRDSLVQLAYKVVARTK